MKHPAATPILSNETGSNRAYVPFVAAVLILVSGCVSEPDGINLDTGLGVGLPQVGVGVDAHCRLSVGKYPKEESDEKPLPVLTGDEQLALLKLQLPPDGSASRDVEGPD